MANDLLRGRQTVAYLTNKSGGGVVAGDVVILGSATASSFTTTTSAAQTADWIGVALETIADNASGRVCVYGYVPAINLASSASLGDYVRTHTVAKQGQRFATPAAGDFGQVLGTGTTPPAIVWARPDQGGGTGGVTEYDYVEVTSNLTVTATSDATAQAFVTGNAVAYDGSTRVKIEFSCMKFECTVNVVANLYDGSTDLGRLGIQAATTSGGGPVHFVRYLTPSNATHTYSIRVFKASGTSTVYGGAGGVATAMPAFMRITKA